jgi:hypothetical protein
MLQLPDYHDVIDHPMDFATVRKQLANGSYSTLEQFEVGALCYLAMYSYGLLCKATARLSSDVLQHYVIFLDFG